MKKYFTDVIEMFRRDIVLVSTVLGFAIRLNFVLWNNFPLNDGGMFYVMVKELINNGFKIPFFTSYNFSEIPYIYPPFGFYFTAIVSHYFNVEVLVLQRFLPVIISTLTIPVFYLISKKLFSEKAAVLSTLVYSISPRGFEWLIMGGGITRSWGALFYLLTVYFSLKLVFDKNKSKLLTGIFLSLAILSHPEWGLFAAGTVLLISIFFKRQKALQDIFPIYISSIILTVPWWLMVLVRHGMYPFLASFKSAGLTGQAPYYFNALMFKITDEPFLSFFGVLAVTGIVVLLTKRKFFVPLWFFSLLLFSARSGMTFSSIPLSMLVGTTLSNINSFFKSNRISNYFICFIFLYGIISALSISTPRKDSWSYIMSLANSDREAMGWVNNNTQKDSRFLTVTNNLNWTWSTDNVSEWFPALSRRKSPLTIQGMEWMKDNSFGQTAYKYSSVKECYEIGLDCLEERTLKNNVEYDYVYVQKSVTDGLSTSLISYQLEASHNYILVFENESVKIFKRK